MLDNCPHAFALPGYVHDTADHRGQGKRSQYLLQDKALQSFCQQAVLRLYLLLSWSVGFLESLESGWTLLQGYGLLHRLLPIQGTKHHSSLNCHSTLTLLFLRTQLTRAYLHVHLPVHIYGYLTDIPLAAVFQ